MRSVVLQFVDLGQVWESKPGAVTRLLASMVEED